MGHHTFTVKSRPGFFFFLFFLRSFSTNQAQVESHFQQDGKLRMKDLLWWQRLQWKVWMHFLRLQVNKGNQTSASHWLPSHAVDDLCRGNARARPFREARVDCGFQSW